MAAKSLLEQLNPKGHLEIIKQYKDGSTETVLSDHNIITVGMGQTLAQLFSQSNFSTSIEDFSIAYFQVGTGTATMASSLTGLTTPFTAGKYGDTELDLVTHKRAGSASNFVFANINRQSVVGTQDKVTFNLTLDENTGNGEDITEIGIFSKNPFKESGGNVSYMVAYRSFSALSKGSGFALIFRWTIQF